MITRLVPLLLLNIFCETVSQDLDQDADWFRDLEPDWTPCITALLMPYDSDDSTSVSEETELPDFPLSGFKILRPEKKLQTHLETAIRLRELLEIMHNDVYGSDSELEDSCRNDKYCIADLIYKYGSHHIRDFTGDHRVNCDDLAVLLYAYHNTTTPITIDCTTFWKLYRRNAAFLKHSQSLDVNDYHLSRNKSFSTKPNVNIDAKVKKTDKDFFICRNKQCGSLYEGGFIIQCDGMVQCVDNSDEEICESCPDSSLRCLVHNVPTCLPPEYVCKYHTTECTFQNGTVASLENCPDSDFVQTFEQCKVFLDRDYRERFGEQVYEENGKEIHTPNRAYRDRLCRLNKESIFPDDISASGTKNHTRVINNGLDDTALPPGYHEFLFINLNQSLCKDQVDQRLGACKDECPEQGEFGDIEFWECNNGRCIDLYAVCDGIQNCKDGEDETLQSCAEIGLKEDDVEFYSNCDSRLFPCPISGKCISNDLVCNGVKDCPDGEDEDSQLWGTVLGNDQESNQPYAEQVRNWTLANPKAQCKHKEVSDCSLDIIIILLVIFVLMAIILAMIMEPIEVEESFLLRAKRNIQSQIKADPKAIAMIDRGPVCKDTVSTFDYLLIQNGFENQKNLKAKIEIKSEMAKQILVSEDMDQERALAKLKTMDTYHTSSLKDHILGSFSLRSQSTVLEKTSNTGEIPETLCTFYKLVKSALPLYIIGAIALEYYLDISLAKAMYSAFKGTNTTGFSFAPYFLGIFVFTCLTLVVSYMAMVFIGSYKTYFRTEKLYQKIFYIISLILTPIFFPAANFLFTLKKDWTPAEHFEDYLDKEVLSLQYQIILNQMTVVKTLLENMPQLYVAFLLSLSGPLYEKIEKFQYPAIVFIFVYVKPIFTMISKAWQITTLHKNERDQRVGTLGNILVCLSVFFCTMSRIFAITFCVIISSCFPDIPFYLYWVSNAGVFQNEITPYAREILYQADISYAPVIFLALVLVAYPIIYYQVIKHFLLKHTLKKHSNKIQFLLAITNNFCPLKPKLDFAWELNDHHNLIINGAIYLSFFINNILFLIFPFIWYGTSLFTTTLPVLDELIRFFRFKNSFGNFPLSFPTEIPTSILKAHIIFPVASIICFLIGSLLFVLYQTKFHLWAKLKPTDVREYKNERSTNKITVQNKVQENDQAESRTSGSQMMSNQEKDQHHE